MWPPAEACSNFDACMQDEFVMIETTGDDGGSLQIVYRNGGDVRASAVEMLCDKVSPATIFVSRSFSYARSFGRLWV